MRYLIPGLKLKIGILGGGQLGWMMILEGRKFPLTFYVMDDPLAPACKIADKCYKPNEYKEMIDNSDIVTFEFEHVSERALDYAYEKGKLIPSYDTILLKREKHEEKLFYKEHGLPTPRFYVVNDGEEALRILKNEFNNFGVIKRSREGYDGKGQYYIFNNPQDFEFLKKMKEPMLVEEYVKYDYEASIILTRELNGKIKYYPPTLNYNEKGILLYNYGPIEDKGISEIAVKLAEELNYVGTMGVEVFVKDDKVLINEFSPRVHNTGHYTLDCSPVSQFENHLRAILGIELGQTNVFTFCGMLNILGVDRVPEDVLNLGNVYWYGKSEVRKRRKMGHINFWGNSIDEVRGKIYKAMKLMYPNGLDL